MEATREASDGSRERRRRRRLRVASPEASAGEACLTAAAALGALLRAGLASFSTNRLSDQLLDEARKDGYIDGAGGAGAAAGASPSGQGSAMAYCDIGVGLQARSLRRSVAGDLDRSLSLCLVRLCGVRRELAAPDQCAGVLTLQIDAWVYDLALASQRFFRSCAFFWPSLNSSADLNFSSAFDSERLLLRDNAEDLRLG